MFTEGRREDMLRLLPSQDNVVVNESLAARYGLKKGDTIELPTPEGTRRFGIAAVVVAYESDSGVIWMDLQTYRRHWKDPVVDIFEVIVEPGAAVQTVREDILARFSKERILFAMPSREFKAEVQKMLDRSFEVNNAVVIVQMIIAGFGIIITLLASVFERTREIGILRSIGMTRNQVSRIVILESMLLGACGGILGSATGILVGWLNLEGFFRIDLGASMRYEVHGPSLGLALLISVIVCGAVRPVSRMAGNQDEHRRSAGIRIGGLHGTDSSENGRP